ncbi:MAG: hypothetical protein CME68_07740 [Halobacteriovoraceae bacterium]|nr:hypothetical protein [Halobacteriovoraceae bacterium]
MTRKEVSMEALANNKILIVDDEKEIAESLKVILTGQSEVKQSLSEKARKLFDDISINEKSITSKMVPSTVYSGKEAIQKVKELKENDDSFALLIIDIKMPEMNGVEAAKVIRSIDPKIEVIFITAYNEFTVFEINEIIGSNISYITKPFKGEEVVSIANKSIAEWNSKSEMIKMVDDISRYQSSMIHNLRNHQTWSKESIENFKESIVLLFKKYFKLKSLVVYEKKDNNENKVIHEFEGKSQQIQKKLENIDFPSLMESPVRMENDENLIFLQMERLYFIFEPENKILSSSEYFFLELISKLSKTLLNELYLENKVRVGSRLSKIGENIGAITHDLKLTLNNLMNATTKAQQSITNQKEVLNNLSYIYSTCQDFESFLWHIQETIKSPTLKKERIHLFSMIEELKESISYLILSHPKLSFIFPSESKPAIFYGEVKSLKRVFLNIIQNSINSFEENKSLVQQKIEFSYELTKEDIIFIIKDNGPGIKEELKDRLFKPLSSFDSPFDIGLGSSIAHSIISNHGGNISFQSKPGETVVKVNLPLS